MTSSEAWLLECGDSLSIAVGDHEMIEYVKAPVCFSVPGSPDYCSSVLFWQNNFVPVMDIVVLHGQVPDKDNSAICLLTYQEVPKAPLQQLALRVNNAPEKIQVDDEHICEFTEDINTSLLMPFALSCFTHAKRQVIVLDIARLCSTEFRDLANTA